MRIGEEAGEGRSGAGASGAGRSGGGRLAFWLGVAGVAVLFVALRWNVYDVPLVRDEGEYAYAAQLLRHGLAPYEHSFLQKPPMVAYSYAAAACVSPGTFWMPRLLAYLFAAAAAALLGYVARREWGEGRALPVMWLVTPMLLLPGRDQPTANTEMFMLLPLVAVLALYVTNRERGGGKAAWFSAGFLAVVTLLYKYTALPVLAVIFAAWWLKERKSFPLYAILGGIVAAVAALGWMVARDGGWHWWECTVRYNRFYADSSNFGFSGLGYWLGRFLKSWWVLFLLLPGLFIGRTRRAQRSGATAERGCLSRSGSEGVGDVLGVSSSGSPAAAAAETAALRSEGSPRVISPNGAGLCPRLWFWLALFAAAWVTTALSRYGHYYIIVMPFWALLAAAGIEGLASWVAGLARPVVASPEPRDADSADNRWQVWLRRLLTAVVVALVCVPDVRTVLASKEQLALGTPDVLAGSKVIAARLAAITSPQDAVFVAGSEPQILCYAQRLSSSRFVIMYPLMMPTPLAEGYQREAVQDLEQHPPAAIVFVAPGSSWLRHKESPTFFLNYLGMILAQRYELVGGYVADELGGRWVEPLAEKELPAACLRLYRLQSGPEHPNR